MAWVRIHDGAMSHPKIVGLPHTAFRLWVFGLSYCQQHLTDGFIPSVAVTTMLRGKKKDADALVDAALWHPTDKGYQVHDFLDWNDSKQEVEHKKRLASHRIAFVRDPALKRRLRERDRDQCRYCGVSVNWSDRKGCAGATYDHVDPYGDATEDNLVIACRSCNSKKRNRTPEQAGMSLRSVDQITDPISEQTNTSTSGLVRSSSSNTEERNDLDKAFTDSSVTSRAGNFVERYQALYAKYRNGAFYMVVPRRDYDSAVRLCKTWDDARLDKLAAIFLTTDHQFAESGSRTITQFAALASWADSKLVEWEQKHGSRA